MNVLPQSTGFGVSVIDLITGAAVSSVTVRVTVVVLPALSLAMIVMVLEPSFSVTSLENVPSVLTVTAVPLTVTVTGLDVTSSVLPVTVTVDLLVISPSVGAVIDSVGGTVSSLNVDVLASDVLPSLSVAITEIVCAPSFNATSGVHVYLYPPVTAVLLTDVISVPSNVILAEATPESESVTVNSILGVALVMYAPEDGTVMLMTGATFSLTLIFSDEPRVACV